MNLLTAKSSSSGTRPNQSTTSQQGEGKSASKNKPPNQNEPPKRDKFKEARTVHMAATQKHLEGYQSSSDEEELACNDILDAVFKGYGNDRTSLEKTLNFLENTFQSGAATCLICLGTVKRNDPIWSCGNCYNFFHLTCIQRWARDSLAQRQLHQELDGGYYTNQGDYIPKKRKTVMWDCPKCRFEYFPDEIPRQYACFCEQELDPKYHPWLLPHSCGETCNKPLTPECGHKCVLLCHPGPCPPCPQTIQKSCKCGRSPIRTIRCAQLEWTCGKKCQHTLKCGIHVCNGPCHTKDECPPCGQKSLRKCVCGQREEERMCSDVVWQCERTCKNPFPCGLHRCEKICHNGPCGNCPAGMPRSCPCGKEMTTAPCSEEIGPCGDTCMKMLPCELHNCAQLCHKGECSACLELIEKKCRCGQQSKEMPCSKVFTCKAKCKQMRDCKKHPCNRVCCDGNCPTCDKSCSKTLSCGRHKCKNLCHNGLCYPCPVKSKVKCRCGSTVIEVPCGRERKTKPPKCNQPCRHPSKCHHTNPHRCHIGDCPPCIQLCLQPNDTTKCGHICNKPCHDSVKVTITDKNFTPAGPWEHKPEVVQVQKLPHPNCDEPITVTCPGGHETVDYPCWNSRITSCGRECNRQLKCGNHVCTLPCHAVQDITTMRQDEDCAPCDEGCDVERPKGCIHPCARPCHAPPCAPCTVLIKSHCHCGLSPIFNKCGELYQDVDENEEEVEQRIEKLRRCGNRCIKNIACGHRCSALCHVGDCTDPNKCKKKVKVFCECKSRKIETTCDKQRNGFVLPCNDKCKEIRSEVVQAQEEKQRKIKEEIEMKNRQELEEYERKYGRKKFRERQRQQIIEEEQTDQFKRLAFFSIVLVGAAVAITVLYFPN